MPLGCSRLLLTGRAHGSPATLRVCLRSEAGGSPAVKGPGSGRPARLLVEPGPRTPCILRPRGGLAQPGRLRGLGVPGGEPEGGSPVRVTRCLV